MTAAELWLAVRARWPYLAGALVLIVVVLGVWLFGKAEYSKGRDLARADIADSIGRVYDARYQAFRDSMAVQIAQFNKGLAAANARADSADARTLRVQQLAAATLTPQVIAQTPPQVLALIVAQSAALDSNRVAMAAVRVQLDTAHAIIGRQTVALTLADSALAQQQRAIDAYKKVKDPPHGFWHVVGTVAKYAGAAAGGILIGLVAH